ncbi:MAG TPA: hypothetical protein VGC74_03010 [Stenotrophomonas sp.]
MLLTGCATASAPEYGGRWRPVNRYPESPQTVALQSTYQFQASPLDGTLKGMLTRWAIDSNKTLSYQARTDYTLYGPMADIRTHDLQEATSRVSALYALQGLVVQVEGERIIVRPGKPIESAGQATIEK